MVVSSKICKKNESTIFFLWFSVPTSYSSLSILTLISSFIFMVVVVVRGDSMAGYYKGILDLYAIYDCSRSRPFYVVVIAMVLESLGHGYICCSAIQ